MAGWLGWAGLAGWEMGHILLETLKLKLTMELIHGWGLREGVCANSKRICK